MLSSFPLLALNLESVGEQKTDGTIDDDVR
jgi:hypothetical protein